MDLIDIYITDSCNMKCNYCYHRNYGLHSIESKKIKKAIDYAFKLNCYSISFLGGEPLTEKEKLMDAIKYIRKKSKEIKIFVYTNGILIKDFIDFFNTNNVNVFLSLDGDFKTFSSNRHFLKSKLESRKLYKDILKSGKKLKNVYILMYINNSSLLLDNLVNNIKYFCRKGFYNFGIEFERYCHWSIKDLKKLNRQFKKLQIFTSKSNKKINILNINDAKERLSKVSKRIRWWGGCDKLILGADGKYYACEKIFSFPQNLRKKAEIGDIKNGIDFNKRDKLYNEAVKFITEKIPDSYLYYYCPMGIYFANKWSNQNFNMNKDKTKSNLLDLMALSKQLFSSFYRFLKYEK